MMETLIDILILLWLFLPAGIANMSPVLFKKVSIFNCPIDGGKTFRGKRVFGAHKTWRGLFSGIMMATLVVYLQKWIGVVDYSDINPLILGPLMGTGALIGDAVESFFKRQRGVKPGHSWIPFDQTDWIIGAVIFAEIYVDIGLTNALIVIVISGLLHPLANLLSFALKFQKVKL